MTTFVCEKLLKAKDITLDTTTDIKDLQPENRSKYLKVTEEDRIQHSSTRVRNFGKNALVGMRSILKVNQMHEIESMQSTL